MKRVNTDDGGTRWGSKGVFVLLVWTMTLVTGGPGVYGAAVAFTGFVDADFTAPGVVTVPDGVDIVDFLPPAAPSDAWSGWDVQEMRLAHDAGTDTLYVGVRVPINTLLTPSAHVIFGDADGDGDPGGTSAWLSTAGGADNADLGGAEFFGLLLNLDGTGDYDAVVGVTTTGDITATMGVYSYNAGTWDPGTSYGTAVAGHAVTTYASPSSIAPDFEFTIANFSTLGTDLALTDTDPLTFGISMRTGSQADDGIGEEAFPTSTITVPEPNSIALALLCICALAGRRTPQRPTLTPISRRA